MAYSHNPSASDKPSPDEDEPKLPEGAFIGEINMAEFLKALTKAQAEKQAKIGSVVEKLVDKIMAGTNKKGQVPTPVAVQQAVSLIPEKTPRGETWKQIRKRIALLAESEPVPEIIGGQELSKELLARKKDLWKHVFCLPNGVRLMISIMKSAKAGEAKAAFNFAFLPDYDHCNCALSLGLSSGEALGKLIGNGWQGATVGHSATTLDNYDDEKVNRSAVLIMFPAKLLQNLEE